MVKTGVNISSDYSRDAVTSDLARRYGNALQLFFIKRGLSRAEAEDLTQEVYVRIARMDDVSTIRKPEAFLFQAAANLLRDKARRDRVRRSTDHIPIESCELPAEDSSPFRVLAGKQTLECILRALNELPARQRDVFVLHRFEELTYTQIAARLGISVSAVEKHMMKAIARVHESWRAGDVQQ